MKNSELVQYNEFARTNLYTRTHRQQPLNTDRASNVFRPALGGGDVHI